MKTNLCFEFQIAVQPIFLVLSHTCISQLKDHFSKQNPSCIHIGHSYDVFCKGCVYRFREARWVSNKKTKRDVPPSSGFASRVTRFSPSIVVDTLLPRNFDFGRSSPKMLTWFAGEI